MHLITVDPVTWQPGNMVKSDIKELTWIERYTENGEFTILVENDVSILDELPLGTLLSHSETLDVMIVEDHEIKRNSDKTVNVIVSGRSFETFMENRVAVPTTVAYFPDPLTDSGTGDENTYNLVDYVSPQNMIRDLIIAGMNSVSPWDPLNNLTVELDVAPIVTMPPTATIQRGQLYDRVLEMLKSGDYGIKTVRPFSLEHVFIEWRIYDGNDLRTTVTFMAANQDFSEAQYFKSLNKSKNVAIIVGKFSTAEYYKPGPGVSGLTRRVEYVEVSDDFTGSGMTPTNIQDALLQRGREAVEAKPPLDLISCKIAETARPTYNVDYTLGDIVTVLGEFGTSQAMRVVEFILTSDKEGIRGFPSLRAI